MIFDSFMWFLLGLFIGSFFMVLILSVIFSDKD